MRGGKILSAGVLWALVVVFAGAGIALADGAAITVKMKEGIGPYLADSKGMTLYYFKNDSPGKSACVGPCVEKWPPFSVEKISVGEGLDAKNVGEIKRDDGKKQATYKGMPLYHFVGDKAPGDTNGNGIKDIWSVVTP
jgi:predicted lipoprotein with Yx(FWY)xxD motif